MLLLLTLLSLTPRSAPDVIASELDTLLRDDSLSASQPLLVPFAAEIRAIARAEQLPPALLAGIIQEESRFDMWATRMEPRYMNSRRVSQAAAIWSRAHSGTPTAFTELTDRSRSYGLMQIMGETAREEGYSARYLASLFHADSGLRAGAAHLKALILRYKSDTLSAISAYNQGSARRRNGVFANARYVYRVAVAWRMYEALFKGGRHDE
jgi:soluble lytic murein transglycosylase-like protein